MSDTVKVLNVAGMSCGHCVESIQKAVGALTGVKNVAVDLQGKTASVTFDATVITEQAITATIEDQGYEVS